MSKRSADEMAAADGIPSDGQASQSADSHRQTVTKRPREDELPSAPSPVDTSTATPTATRRLPQPNKKQKLQHLENISGTCAVLKAIGTWLLDERIKLDHSTPAKRSDSPSPSATSSKSGSSASGTTNFSLNGAVLNASAKYITSLKRWHREAYESGRASKALSVDAREAVDRVQLDLQNLRYECWHLEREIEKCESFKSIYQDVELVPEDEFLAKAPSELTSSSDDPHQRMLNRLKYEMMERIRLEQEKGNQLSLSIKLKKEIREKKAAVENFEKELEGIYQIVLAVQGRLKLADVQADELVSVAETVKK